MFTTGCKASVMWGTLTSVTAARPLRVVPHLLPDHELHQDEERGARGALEHVVGRCLEQLGAGHVDQGDARQGAASGTRHPAPVGISTLVPDVALAGRQVDAGLPHGGRVDVALAVRARRPRLAAVDRAFKFCIAAVGARVKQGDQLPRRQHCFLVAQLNAMQSSSAKFDRDTNRRRHMELVARRIQRRMRMMANSRRFGACANVYVPAAILAAFWCVDDEHALGCNIFQNDSPILGAVCVASDAKQLVARPR